VNKERVDSHSRQFSFVALLLWVTTKIVIAIKKWPTSRIKNIQEYSFQLDIYCEQQSAQRFQSVSTRCTKILLAAVDVSSFGQHTLTSSAKIDFKCV